MGPARWLQSDHRTARAYRPQRGKLFHRGVDHAFGAALLAKTEAMVMHCLPAHKGYEVSEGVMASPRCVAVDQAENRMHAQNSIMTFLSANGSAS